jgi:hypothetical protein
MRWCEDERWYSGIDARERAKALVDRRGREEDEQSISKFDGLAAARHRPLSHAQINYRTMTGCVVDYGGTAFVVQPWPFTLIFCAAPDEVC